MWLDQGQGEPHSMPGSFGCGISPGAPLLPERMGSSPSCPPSASLTVHVPQALRVNSLEQLCNNLASERLQLFSSQMLLAQEEVR